MSPELGINHVFSIYLFPNAPNWGLIMYLLLLLLLFPNPPPD